MRGGTSKGLYLDAAALPSDRKARDQVLLAAMGSSDTRQIDGLGGGHPLTSKVAVLSPAGHGNADIDYLFLQVDPDKLRVSDSQNCGNILAGVGPWAIENGYVAAQPKRTPVRIFMVNTGASALAHVPTPGGVVDYEGDTAISGVPGTAAAIPLDFLDIAGANCGALLPTGNTTDEIAGTAVTCIDNGMPLVLIRAADLGIEGNEPPQLLQNHTELKSRIEDIRLAAGRMMNLGDVSDKTVPKMTLLAPPSAGGTIATRSFIPHSVHESIGVLAAVSVASGCVLADTVAAGIANLPGDRGRAMRLNIEHPSGFLTVEIETTRQGGDVKITRSALIRTARKLMQGTLFVPSHAWPKT